MANSALMLSNSFTDVGNVDVSAAPALHASPDRKAVTSSPNTPSKEQKYSTDV